MYEQAREFVEALERMSEKEKRLLMYVFRFGCPTELPDNVHIAADLLRRVSGMSVSRCFRELQKLESLGVTTQRRLPEDEDDMLLIELSIFMRGVDYDGPDNATNTVNEMIGGLSDMYCSQCALKALLNGDFSALARATCQPERHSGRAKAAVAHSDRSH